MSISYRTNIFAQLASQDLRATSNRLSSSYERLSSGLRINRASDDAAGLALATKTDKDGRVFTQSIRNGNDAISLLQVADSAVEELQNITVRIQELAQQAANSSLSSGERQALDEEADALVSEYSRITASTQFNNRYLLNGDLPEFTTQLGVDDAGGSVLSILPEEVEGQTVGSAEFTVSGTVSSTSGAREVQLGDLDNDGDNDLFYASSSQAFFALNDGEGNFDTPVSLGVSGSGVSYIESGDLDEDGYLDLVVTEGTNDYVNVFINNQDGTFAAASTTASAKGSLDDQAIADFDNDGNLDVAAAGSTSPAGTEFFWGDGNGGFSASSTVTTGVAASVAAGDFDGDGVDDYALTATTVADMQILISNGDRTFQTSDDYTTSGGPDELKVGDMNGDGALDIVVGAYTSGYVDVFINKNDGTGDFYAKQSYAATGAEGISLGDLDGDNDLDVVYSRSGTSAEIGVMLNDGSGALSTPDTYSVEIFSVGNAIGDIDGDGIPDIVGGAQAGNITKYINGTTTRGGLPEVDLTTVSTAEQAVTDMEGVSESLTADRGNIAAAMSRLSSSVANIALARDGMQTASSKIRDVDAADQTAQLIKQQVLQDSATAILAQANLQPENALQLLSVLS